jgi:hypothetical protein
MLFRFAIDLLLAFLFRLKIYREVKERIIEGKFAVARLRINIPKKCGLIIMNLPRASFVVTVSFSS